MNETLTEEYKVTIERDKKTGRQLAQYWRNLDGQLGRGDKPAIIHFDLNTGLHERVETYNDGKLHCLNGPAIEIFDPKRNALLEEHWYMDGQMHRSTDEPALTIADSEGNILRHEYWAYGKRHRPVGPAIIEYDPKTNLIMGENYFINGGKVKNSKSDKPLPP